MDSIIDYSRQEEFVRTFENAGGLDLPNQHHIIIGCGGVGFWLGIILAMQGATSFTLVEGQTIEPSNLNRLPVPLSWVGRNKAVALRKVIRQMRPQTTILVLGKHLTPNLLDAQHEYWRRRSSIFWDCTDDARIQRVVFDYCKKHNFTYRKIGYEGFQIGSYVDYNVWIPADYRPGYRTSNACAATSALAAVIGFFTQGLGITADVKLNMKEVLGYVEPEPEVDQEEERETEEDETEVPF